jgi:hypothetical protein
VVQLQMALAVEVAVAEKLPPQVEQVDLVLLS